jgi:hypothetical protein
MTEISTFKPLLLFISHSSGDLDLAQTVVTLIEAAFRLPSRQVRCTSVPGYKLSVGADSDEQLRREVYDTKAFVALLTPNSIASTYVLFELGARWAAKKHFAPLLSRGLTIGQLRAPLSSLTMLDLHTREGVAQLVDDLASYLELPLEPMASFQRAIDAVVAEAGVLSSPLIVSRPAMMTDREEKILKAAISSRLTAYSVMRLLSIGKEKSEYYLQRLVDVGALERVSRTIWEILLLERLVADRYRLAQKGREYLIENGLL